MSLFILFFLVIEGGCKYIFKNVWQKNVQHNAQGSILAKLWALHLTAKATAAVSLTWPFPDWQAQNGLKSHVSVLHRVERILYWSNVELLQH